MVQLEATITALPNNPSQPATMVALLDYVVSSAQPDLLNYKKEIPYSVEILVNSFKEEELIIRIQADILVERDSQKGIIIGNKGAALKKVGILARKDMETFFQKQVYIELFVKVDKDWRNNDKRLKNFGY